MMYVYIVKQLILLAILTVASCIFILFKNSLFYSVFLFFIFFNHILYVVKNK